LIIAGEKSMAEITYDFEFENSLYFSKLFKKKLV
jgi:AraC-like DNA-binding protein